MCRILFALPEILLFRSVVFPLFFKLHFLVPFYFITFAPTRSLVVNFPNDITAAMLVPSRIKLYSYTNEPFNFWLLKNDVRGKLTVVFSYTNSSLSYSYVLLYYFCFWDSSLVFGSIVLTLLSTIEALLHVKVAILMILHKEKAAMLVSQTHSSRVELYFYATTSCRLGNTSMCKLIIFHTIVLFRSYLVVPFYNIGSSLFLRLRPDAPLYCMYSLYFCQALSLLRYAKIFFTWRDGRHVVVAMQPCWFPKLLQQLNFLCLEYPWGPMILR